jgi:hypothetical protein
MIASALSSRRRRAVGVIVLRHPRIAWLQDAIAKAPKRIEPACDFRARHDQVGVDPAAPIPNRRARTQGWWKRATPQSRPVAFDDDNSMTIKRDLKPGHGCHSHTHNREYIVTAKDVAPRSSDSRYAETGLARSRIALGCLGLGLALELGANAVAVIARHDCLFPAAGLSRGKLRGSPTLTACLPLAAAAP